DRPQTYEAGGKGDEEVLGVAANGGEHVGGDQQQNDAARPQQGPPGVSPLAIPEIAQDVVDQDVVIDRDQDPGERLSVSESFPLRKREDRPEPPEQIERQDGEEGDSNRILDELGAGPRVKSDGLARGADGLVAALFG